MFIEQTVEIPTNRRVYFDLPQDVPCGMADFEIVVSPRHKDESAKPLRGLFKDCGLTVDRFLAMKREEEVLEYENEECNRREREQFKL